MNQNLGILFRSVGVSLALALLPLAASGLTPRVPLIELNASGAGSQSSSGRGLAAEGASDKMMMPNPFSYTYAAGSELSDQTGKGKIYKVLLDGDPEQILVKIAKIFGISGSAYESEFSQPGYPSFQIGSKDGVGPSAAINWSGTGSWWFNNPSAYPSPKCNTWAKSDEGADYCNSYEEQKATPELIPTRDKLIATALEIFNATGLKVSAGDIKTDISDWGANASAALRLDGKETPIEWYISWGSNGKLGSVSGNSVRFEDQGSVSTISAKSAVNRISDWRYSGQISSSLWAKYAPPVRAGEPGMIAYDSPVENGQTPEPASSPEPILVTINEAHSVSVLIWDKNGSAWLVPGYVLIGDQGWLTPVFALEDGVVALPDPVAIEPYVMEPGVVAPGVNQTGDVSPMVK